MDLAPKAIILVFAGKLNSFEPVENDLHSLGGLGQHGLDGDAHSDVAGVLQALVLISAGH